MKKKGPSYCTSLLILSLFSSVMATAQSENMEDSGRAFGIVVGISDYQDQKIKDLSYAHLDAQSFEAYLQRTVPGVKTILLKDEEATHDKVIAALKNYLIEAEPGDTLFFFFSGHGDCETDFSDELGFLLTYNTPAHNYLVASLRVSDLEKYMSAYLKKESLEVVLFIDACRAGKLATQNTSGPGKTAASLLDAFQRETLFLSCEPDEVSMEYASLQHGVFTHFLVEGLSGAADSDQDLTLVVEELKRYLLDSVSVFTRRRQNPVASGKPWKVLPMDRQFNNRFDPAEQSARTKKESERTLILPMITSPASSDEVPSEDKAKKLLQLFNQALEEGRLTRPNKNSALHYYRTFPNDEKHRKAKLKMRARLLQALEGVPTELLLQYLKAEHKGISQEACEQAVDQLNASVSILPPGDFQLQRIRSRYFFFLGLLEHYQRRPNWKLASRALATSLDIEPMAAYAHNASGIIFLNRNQLAEAETAFRQATQLTPNWDIPAANLETVTFLKDPPSGPRVISGIITDDTKMPLIGASVLVKGTTSGAVTDLDGRFLLMMPEGTTTLVISYTGFATHEVSPNARNYLEIELQEDAIALWEVVVSALGITREKKALGYSISELGDNDLLFSHPNTITQALSGRIAGLQIGELSSGPAATSQISIRGRNSLTSNNQPLFVVNGMPVNNTLFSPDNGPIGASSIDFGTTTQAISPHDVESITVLKGLAAAPLHGPRARDGVVLITTKKGQYGWRTNFNTSTYFESVLKMPDFQNEYGYGGTGFYSFRDGLTPTTLNGIAYYDAFGENWGLRMDDALVKQWNSQEQPVPFTQAEDNIKNFYQTGISNSNHIAIAHRREKGDFRLSYTNYNRRGVLPHTQLNRNGLYTSFSRQKGRFNLRVNGMFMRSTSGNIPAFGLDESNSIPYTWSRFGRQLKTDDLKNYWQPGQEQKQQSNAEYLWTNNPWLLTRENTNSFQDNHFIGNTQLRYDLWENANLIFAFGLDIKDEQRQYRRATSSISVPFGSYREDDISALETNTQFLFSWIRHLGESFDLDLKAGGNFMHQSSDIQAVHNPELLQPGRFTLENNRSGLVSRKADLEKSINSVFGIANLGFNGFLYAKMMVRNDWARNPWTNKSSHLYPSVSLSAVPTDVMRIGPWLSFLKVYASYAEVANPVDPNLLESIFLPNPFLQAYPAYWSDEVVPNAELKAERTQGIEWGMDARLFRNRLGLEIAYYDTRSKDQVLFQGGGPGIPLQLLNGGGLSNRGIEIALSASPIRHRFQWEVMLHLSRNQTMVTTLPENYPIYSDVFPGRAAQTALALMAVEGELAGQLWGRVFQRHANGSIIHENGLPLYAPEPASAGSWQPDWTGGLWNEFSFKGFQLSVLFQAQFGGKIYSQTHALLNANGTITNFDDLHLGLSTLDGRPEYAISYNAQGEPEYRLLTPGGIIGPGLMYDEDGKLVPNEVTVSPRDYFQAYYAGDNIEAATFDATYVKLKELRLTYQFPKSFLQKIRLKDASVSLIGRNLALWSNTPSIDPETFSIRNGRFLNGFENLQLPSLKSIGFAIQLSF